MGIRVTMKISLAPKRRLNSDSMKLFFAARISLVMKFLLAVILFAAFTTFAGTIVGNVSAQGKAGMGSNSASSGAYANRKYKFAPKVDYAAMHVFVVYIDGPLGTNTALSTNVVSVVTTNVAQHSAMFDPHVQPVMV